MVSSSKVVQVMVCGLDHSGSQPFNYDRDRENVGERGKVYSGYYLSLPSCKRLKREARLSK